MPDSLHPVSRALATILTLGMIAVTSFVARAEEPDEPKDDSMTHATRLTDFTDPDHNDRWEVLNDNVMGGRSKGGMSFETEHGVMTFAGDINTNGGGFSSIRLPLEAGTLTNVTHLTIRLRADARGPYRVLVTDDLPERERRINHRLELPLDPEVAAGEWQTISIALADLQPSWRGDLVDAEPLDASRAVELGFIINDTKDGPFKLDFDWIEVVRSGDATEK